MLIHYPDIDDHLDFLENQEGNLFFLSRAQIAMNNCEPFVKEVIDTIINNDDKHTVIIVEDSRPTGGDGTSEKQCSPSVLKSSSMTATTRFMPSLCQQSSISCCYP